MEPVLVYHRSLQNQSQWYIEIFVRSLQMDLENEMTTIIGDDFLNVLEELHSIPWEKKWIEKNCFRPEFPHIVERFRRSNSSSIWSSLIRWRSWSNLLTLFLNDGSFEFVRSSFWLAFRCDEWTRSGCGNCWRKSIENRSSNSNRFVLRLYCSFVDLTPWNFKCPCKTFRNVCATRINHYPRLDWPTDTSVQYCETLSRCHSHSTFKSLSFSLSNHDLFSEQICEKSKTLTLRQQSNSLPFLLRITTLYYRTINGEECENLIVSIGKQIFKLESIELCCREG